MASDFHSTQTDNMTKIIDLFCKGRALSNFRVAQASLWSLRAGLVWLMCSGGVSQENRYIAKINKGNSPLGWGQYSAHETLKSGGSILQTIWHTSKLVQPRVRIDGCFLTSRGVHLNLVIPTICVKSWKYSSISERVYAPKHLVEFTQTANCFGV